MSSIIVKNLPKKITAQRLQDEFSVHGQITNLQLKYTKDGVFRQFAFIGFKTEKEALAAKNYFHNTFIDTSKIKVDICADLGDTNKPRPWSKYSQGSSAFQKKVKTTDKNDPEVKKSVKKEKSRSEKVLEGLSEDPEFREFLEVHKNRATKPLWSDDIPTAVKETNENLASSSVEPGSKVADLTEKYGVKTAQGTSKGLSDLEYLKTKMMSSAGDNDIEADSGCSSLEDNEEESPKKQVEKRLSHEEFTLKLRGLPYKCKKKHIQDFFKPLKPISLRLPPKVKGIAYVGFRTEKDMKQGLIKHRGFLDGQRISVVKYNRKEGAQQVVSEKQKKNPETEPEESVAESGRIYVRNLTYSVSEEEIEKLFSKYGKLTEVHLPIDRFTRKCKGFAFVTFMFPEHAVKAFSELDGKIFQGRLMHLLPGKAKKSLEDVEGDGSYKKKKEVQLKVTSGSSHNWNSLFLGANAVADIIAEKYDTTKSNLLNTETTESVAVRMALGETQIVSETRDFLLRNNVHLDAFSQPATERSKTVILVKNLPANTEPKEMRELFSKFGEVSRIVLPPTGVTCIVEFQEPAEARVAYQKLAYSKFHHVPLYLEWAPVNTFSMPAVTKQTKEEELTEEQPEDENKKNHENEFSVNLEELADEVEEPDPDTSLFVKNLNFDTTEKALTEHFQKCGPLHSVSIARKKNVKKPGDMLSMGYGFVQFKNKDSAKEAIKELQHSLLDGHALELKLSHRATLQTPTTSRKKAKVSKQKSSKILIRNIPFQATKKEVQELFSVFGELKAVRLPKKFSGTGTHRGFGFVDFLTRNDAKRAFKALCHSTHLYGRRLVLEWADTDDTEVETLRKRTAEHFHDGSISKGVKKSSLMAELDG
ncbi:putative RNA-binding protein 19 [Tachypleus tridentatus]|uniref:putative RNA-binding protein 19 n=1 Tax=Tachypleus tridentatus TaxID=6853 RepID=UPI003FD5AB75